MHAKTAKTARWLIPIAMLAAVGWLGTRAKDSFLRLPVAPGPAPEWTLSDLAGARLSSTNFSGRVVVLNFWATWCAPCRRELPDLKAFHLAHTNDGVTVIGLSRDEAGSFVVRTFVEQHALPYPILVATPEVVDAFGGPGPIPATFVIGRDGRFVAHYLGAVPRAELERVVAPLLAK